MTFTKILTYCTFPYNKSYNVALAAEDFAVNTLRCHPLYWKPQWTTAVPTTAIVVGLIDVAGQSKISHLHAVVLVDPGSIEVQSYSCIKRVTHYQYFEGNWGIPYMQLRAAKSRCTNLRLER